MTPQGNYIPRKLSCTDQDSKTHSIREDDLLNDNDRPVVILGEPGMGKTRLMRKLKESDNCTFFRATSFLRQPDNSVPRESRLIIDGLDEVAAKEEGDPLHNVLKKLIACGSPHFIISCRSAEWRM